jgi:hypothetical protein
LNTIGGAKITRFAVFAHFGHFCFGLALKLSCFS